MLLKLGEKKAEVDSSLFWDMRPEDVSAEKNSRLIIQRVLMRGNFSELRGVFNLYGEERFISIAKNLKSLDRKTLNYLSSVFNIDKSEFRCYRERQF